MKKANIVKIAITLILTFVLCTATVAFAYTPSITYEFEKDSIVYRMQVSPGTSRLRSTDSNVSMKLEVSSEQEIEIATTPLIATDEYFSNIIEISDISYNEGVLDINLAFEQIPETIYMRTPFVAKLVDSNVIVDDVNGLDIENYYNTQLQCNIAVITFDANDFEMVPNQVTLVYNEHTLPSLYVNQYFDEHGECLGGEIAFINSENFTLNNNYTLIFEQIHTVAATETVAIHTGS